MSSESAIRERFEHALVVGLEVRTVTDAETGEAVKIGPEAQFLSVVRAYLKDQSDKTPKAPSLPATGDSKGILAEFARTNKSLPFGGVKQ